MVGYFYAGVLFIAYCPTSVTKKFAAEQLNSNHFGHLQWKLTEPFSGEFTSHVLPDNVPREAVVETAGDDQNQGTKTVLPGLRVHIGHSGEEAVLTGQLLSKSFTKCIVMTAGHCLPDTDSCEVKTTDGTLIGNTLFKTPMTMTIPTRPNEDGVQTLLTTDIGFIQLFKDDWCTNEVWHRLIKITKMPSTGSKVPVIVLGGPSGIVEGHLEARPFTWKPWNVYNAAYVVDIHTGLREITRKGDSGAPVLARPDEINSTRIMNIVGKVIGVGRIESGCPVKGMEAMTLISRMLESVEAVCDDDRYSQILYSSPTENKTVDFHGELESGYASPD